MASFQTNIDESECFRLKLRMPAYWRELHIYGNAHNGETRVAIPRGADLKAVDLTDNSIALDLDEEPLRCRSLA
ncbi:hypothetical protein Tco_0257489 [Tanacetum coccineum]